MKYLGTYKTKRRTNNKTRCNCETFREIHSEGEGNAQEHQNENDDIFNRQMWLVFDGDSYVA